MTTNISQRSNVSLTNKFRKDLSVFFKWADNEKYFLINKSNNNIVNWSINLLQNFEEPTRNKIDAFLKSILQHNLSIVRDSEVILDYKILSKEFKQFKPNKDFIKSTIKLEYELTPNHTINSSEFPFLKTLDTSFVKITQILGDPSFGEPTDKFRHEWCFDFNKSQYSIYDWKNKNGYFDNVSDSKWHLSGLDKNKKNISIIQKIFIDNTNTNKFTNTNANTNKITSEDENLDIYTYNHQSHDNINFCNDILVDILHVDSHVYDDYDVDQLKTNFELDEIDGDLDEILNELNE